MKNFYKYTLIAFLISCGNETSKELVNGVVTSSEWYVYSIGFSPRSASGYYKQKIKYSFVIDNKTYYGAFNNGPDIGPLFKGDSVIIEITEGVVESNRVVRRHKSTREKSPPVNSNSINENAFDSAYVELLKRSHLPEVEIKQ